jgi:PST family polysaccharide transporter
MTTLPTQSRGAARVALNNMAWVLGDKVVAMVLGLVIFGLIARALGPSGSGHFAYATALLQVGLGLSLVCSGAALLPRFCRMHAALPGAIANVFVVRMVASLLAMLAAMAFCVATIADPQRLMVSLIVLVAVPLIEPFYVIATYWSSRNHNQPTIVARSSGLIARAIVVIVALRLGAPVWVLACAWIVEGVVNAAIQTGQIRRAMPGRQLRRFVRPSRGRAYFEFGVRFVASLWLQVLFSRLDRLLLSERMPAESFGIYTTAMQLTDVWTQVAYLIGVSMATAYLYQRVREGRFAKAFLGISAAMAVIGLLGVAAAWIAGPAVLRMVFGAPFVASQPYLVAGMAVAALQFVDQILLLTLTTLDRPHLLTTKWIVAVAVAAPAIWFGYEAWGAFSGPIGLGLGLGAGWLLVAVALLPRRRDAAAR